MAQGKQQDDSKQSKQLTPGQYDQLIRSAQRDQFAIWSAMGGLLLFMCGALVTREHGLDIYRMACIGAIVFGLAGWVAGELMMRLHSADGAKRVGLGGAEEPLVQMKETSIDALKPGMVLAAAVIDVGGEELLPAGTRLDEEQITALRRMGIQMVLIQSEVA